DMVSWLAERGVETKTESDNRMFPVSDSSQTIIDTFLNEAKKYKVTIRTKCGVKKMTPLPDGKWNLSLDDGTSQLSDKVVVAMGSQPASWRMMEGLGLEMISQVPSLFTFHCQDERLKDLQGLSFLNVEAKIMGTKISTSGPMLITHWGMSGPAVLKLSAWGARELSEQSYKFTILVNFMGKNQEEVRNHLVGLKTNNSKKLTVNVAVEGVPKRYWQRLCEVVGIRTNQTFGEISKKQLNKFVEELTNANFQIDGKSTFKEEFVTAGGVSLSEIDFKTMQSKRFPNLHLSGEVLDIDAVTGGFNFQACWSTAWVIAHSIADSEI
ncbi:MAG: putative Rossmann fold flavoprotein, partial [Arenicella sp.]